MIANQGTFVAIIKFAAAVQYRSLLFAVINATLAKLTVTLVALEIKEQCPFITTAAREFFHEFPFNVRSIFGKTICALRDFIEWTRLSHFFVTKRAKLLQKHRFRI
eukprot:TRINITY_DN1622_c0_g1_i3.p2 TRINITY_DN1622_c0_g1~~TRINITY_DN1622_c0_g1_i3.p2  ORF type:complete len:106 (+),score=5.41 TRINITY_DN1622_c0_g1_i3:66-383(+)